MGCGASSTQVYPATAPEAKVEAVVQLSAHEQIKQSMEDTLKRSRAWPGRDAGSGSLKQALGLYIGFVMPWGTEFGFWNRLKMSVTFRHLFSYDRDFLKTLKGLEGAALKAEYPAAQITVNDVDSAVNNCALISALLLGIPSQIIGGTVGNQDGWLDLLHFYKDLNGNFCQPSSTSELLYSDYCMGQLSNAYQTFYVTTTVSFYSALFTLITAVVYYLCRPSETSNVTSMNTLLKACTLEIRKEIRELRSESEESKQSVKPETPFPSWGEELEVFMKAKFMAKNEVDEQKNMEFYVWYRSEKLCSTLIFRAKQCACVPTCTVTVA